MADKGVEESFLNGIKAASLLHKNAGCSSIQYQVIFLALWVAFRVASTAFQLSDDSIDVIDASSPNAAASLYQCCP